MNPIRKIARTIVPKPVRHAMRMTFDGNYRLRQAWERDARYGRLVHQHTGGVVIAGPFKGLKYVESAQGSTIGPKLLGTYEKELNGIVEAAVARGYQTVINVGAGEGYYGVGFANRLPAAHVICYDGFEKNREQIQKLAELNGVADRIEIKGFCTAETLNEDLAKHEDVLIVMDVEGAEMDILSPAAAPRLDRADLMVEMHDILKKGISPEIRRRFEPTHDITVLWEQKRTHADWPAGVSIDPREAQHCMAESRGGKMSWFWMAAKATRGAARAGQKISA